MRSDPVLSILLRFVLCLVCQGLLSGSALSLDLSIMSDFGAPDFSRNSALVVQNGNANRANILQSNDLGSVSGNYAEIKQVGGGNDASITQSGGDHNRARIDQTGESHIAKVTQTGFTNSADIIQTGRGNALDATQTGNNNSIIFSQLGLGKVNLVQSGNDNTLDIKQAAGTGTGTTTTIRQDGNGSKAIVSQN